MYLLLLLGLAVLIVAGEFLVKGAVGISVLLKLSPLVIGMTVVSFGTSMPELLVSANSALAGNPEIAIGNVIGSNIANIAFILGISVIILPIIVEEQTKKIDYPVMLFSTLVFYAFAFDNLIERWEGILLFIILIVFIYRMISKSRKEEKIKALEALKNEEVNDAPSLPAWKSALYLLVGLVGLYFGADWFVDGAVQIATSFGLSQAVIGVTVVALGTSAPELIASVVAALRKQADLSIGNIIGSNIFNIFAVLGITAIIKPTEVTNDMLNFDSLWMIGISLLLLPMIYFSKSIGRLAGTILFTVYLAYLVVIVLKIKGIF